LLLMPWVLGCSAFQTPSPECSLSKPCSKDQVQQVLEGCAESPRHTLNSICGHEIWCSRRPRHGLFYRVGHAGMQPPLKGRMWARCWPLGAARILPLTMSPTRTTFSAEYTPSRSVWRPLLHGMECFFMPRRSLHAPCMYGPQVYVSAFPRAAREAPLVASTRCVFMVA
jgi:hypothetical protein